MTNALGRVAISIHEHSTRGTVLETVYRFVFDHFRLMLPEILHWVHVGPAYRMTLGSQVLVDHSDSKEPLACMKNLLDGNIELPHSSGSKSGSTIEEYGPPSILLHQTYQELVDTRSLLAVDMQSFTCEPLVELD